MTKDTLNLIIRSLTLLLVCVALILIFLIYSRPSSDKAEIEATRERIQFVEDSMNKVVEKRDSVIEGLEGQKMVIDSLQKNTAYLENLLLRHSTGVQKVKEIFVKPKKDILIAPAKGQLDVLKQHLER